MKWFSNGLDNDVVSSFIFPSRQLLGYHFLSYNEWVTPCDFWTLWGLEYTALQEYPIQLQVIWHFLNREVFMAIFWGACSEYLMLDKHVIKGRVWLVEGTMPLVEAPFKVCGWVIFPETCVIAASPKVQGISALVCFPLQGASYRSSPLHPAGFLWRQWTVKDMYNPEYLILPQPQTCVAPALTKSSAGSARVAAAPADLQTGFSCSCTCLGN